MRFAVYLFVLMDWIVLTTGLYNAALFKPAIQSTTVVPDYAYLAVDGNTDDDATHGSCQHTQLETLPWLIVDLRGQFVVDTIRLTNRGDLGPNFIRLRNFKFDIFQQDPRNLANFPNINGDVCYNQTAPLSIGTYNYTCPVPIVGRFVRLSMNLNSADHLNVCEIEVLVSNYSFEKYLFTIKENTKLSGSVLDTLTVSHLTTCIQECLDHRSPRCTAFHWVTTSNTCQLFSVNPSLDLKSFLTSATGTHVYIQDNILLTYIAI